MGHLVSSGIIYKIAIDLSRNISGGLCMRKQDVQYIIAIKVADLPNTFWCRYHVAACGM